MTWKNPTKADFNAYKKEILRCIDFMGLHEWRVTFEFSPLDTCYAEIHTLSDNFIAHFVLSSKHPDQQAADCFNPIESAQHEAAHLMTARICYIARSRYIRPDDIEEEWERVTRLIQRMLL